MPARRPVVPTGARRSFSAVRTHLPRRSTARTLAAPVINPLYPLPSLSLFIMRTAARAFRSVYCTYLNSVGARAGGSWPLPACCVVRLSEHVLCSFYCYFSLVASMGTQGHGRCVHTLRAQLRPRIGMGYIYCQRWFTYHCSFYPAALFRTVYIDTVFDARRNEYSVLCVCG